MQRSRHYGTSYSSSVPVEEVHAEKEEDLVFQETGRTGVCESTWFGLSSVLM